MAVILIFFICILSGILTGLLGVGGGIIILPLFLFILPLFGIQFELAEIIGISATCVFTNSASTVFYRRKEKFLPFNMLIPFAVAIIIGTVLGSYYSDFAPKQIILGIYILVSLFSLYVINGEVYCNLTNKALKPLLYILFAFIGAISASIGIGGAVLFASTLKCFMGKNIKELLPSITILVLIHACFAFLSKFFLGHITIIIIPLAVFASLIGSKIGVLISKRLSAKVLNILLSVILVLGLIKIIFELF